MKKILLALGVAAACASPAMAQHARQGGVGVNLGVAPMIEGDGSPTNFTLGFRGQYSFTDALRGVVDANFGVADKHISTFDATANVNVMIPLSGGFYMYPLAGLGVGNIHWGYDNWSHNETKFVFNVGVGAEYEFSSNFAAGLEFKYRFMKEYQALPVMLNLSYKF